jgi:multidrug resistance efflux pump
MPLNSRAHMEAVIRNGASVMLPNLRVVTRLEDLPPEAELAAMEVKIAERAARDAAALDDTNPVKSPAIEGARQALAAAKDRESRALASLKAQAARLNAQVAAAEEAERPAPPKVGSAPVDPPKSAPAMAPVARPVETPKAAEKK